MRIVLLLLTLLVLAPIGADAADDVSAARSVISRQEQALARDDAAAYAQAAPDIHALFPTADIFMAMVKQGYAPVYRHKSFEFGESKIDGGTVAQRVHIVDANGEAWEALYTLTQQPDGSLKITGCSLLKAGQSV